MRDYAATADGRTLTEIEWYTDDLSPGHEHLELRMDPYQRTDGAYTDFGALAQTEIDHGANGTVEATYVWGYDARQRMVSFVHEELGRQVTSEAHVYDDDQLVEARVWSSGELARVSQYSYDADGRLRETTVEGADGTFTREERAYAHPAPSLDHVARTWDDEGRATVVQTRRYDDRGREIYSWSTSPSGPVTETRTYEGDRLAERTSTSAGQQVREAWWRLDSGHLSAYLDESIVGPAGHHRAWTEWQFHWDCVP